MSQAGQALSGFGGLLSGAFSKVLGEMGGKPLWSHWEHTSWWIEWC